MKITNEGPIGNHFKKENIFLGTITSSNDDVFEELKGRVNSEVPLDFLRGMIDAGVISGQQYDLFYLDENGYTRFLEEGPETFKGDNSDGKGTIDNVVPAWDYFGEDDLTEVLVNDIETITPGNYSLKVSSGWVYYINAENKLEAIKTNGKNRKQISDEEIAKFQVYGKYIYYSTRDSDFRRMKIDGSHIENISSGIDNFQISGSYAYYISKANHHLVKIDLNENREEEAIAKYVRTFNIVNDTIYYVTQVNNNEVAMYKVKTNGKKDEKIVDLQSVNVYINVIGDWIYYTDYTEDSIYYYSIYKIRTNGKDKQKVNL